MDRIFQTSNLMNFNAFQEDSLIKKIKKNQLIYYNLFFLNHHMHAFPNKTNSVFL
jgi:hypothetical protein